MGGDWNPPQSYSLRRCELKHIYAHAIKDSIKGKRRFHAAGETPMQQHDITQQIFEEIFTLPIKETTPHMGKLATRWQSNINATEREINAWFRFCNSRSDCYYFGSISP